MRTISCIEKVQEFIDTKVENNESAINLVHLLINKMKEDDDFEEEKIQLFDDDDLNCIQNKILKQQEIVKLHRKLLINRNLIKQRINLNKIELKNEYDIEEEEFEEITDQIKKNN